ncbi:hypothetical protein FG91_03827 [Sphingopyxis sp. LC81]|uniref:hypothetical protein n=1 Tax=unclassified Sphingopyxis TaxID=2614943 RepID=UPI00050EC78F|nr:MULTISPECIES: hypothetical protein [unclassified Sphingopyxis]KGB51919.1 hypothetical protein FG91_03827 [Sphingopyxis sp. LC81]MDT7531088.1 hypothetical protein [Sphingopyxis sp. SE2]
MRPRDLPEALLLTLCMAGLAGAGFTADAGLAEFGGGGRYALLFGFIRAVAVCGALMVVLATGGSAIANLLAKRRRRVAAVRLWRI